MAENSKIEIIPNFPKYGADKEGFIWSFQSGFWIKLKSSEDTYGRLRVNLGRGNTRYIHRLILLVFKGECPKGMECCHNDGDNQNNKLENLRWDTPKSNMRDQYLHNTRVMGEKHPQSKITDKERISIRERYNNGEKQSDLAFEFNLTQPTISYIVNFITYGKY